MIKRSPTRLRRLMAELSVKHNSDLRCLTKLLHGKKLTLNVIKTQAMIAAFRLRKKTMFIMI